jgi:hypothetical protein
VFADPTLVILAKGFMFMAYGNRKQRITSAFSIIKKKKYTFIVKKRSKSPVFLMIRHILFLFLKSFAVKYLGPKNVLNYYLMKFKLLCRFWELQPERR